MCANNDAQPQTIWVSKTGDFEDFGFTTPGLATDSFSFNPPTPQINGIEWLSLQNGLNVGTSDSVWKVFASTGGVITPTDVNIKIDSAIGTLALDPIAIGNSILLTPRGLSAVTEATTSFEASGYVPRDLTILAQHLFEDRRIIRWAYAKSPDSVIWCVLDDGMLLGFTYEKAYDVWAWHKHTTPLGVGFADVAVIPNTTDDNIDDVYFIINRAEPGETGNYYLEILNKRITSQTAAFGLSATGTPYDYKFLDSALTKDSPATIAGALQASQAIITITAHPFSNDDLIKIENVIGMTELNGNIYKVSDSAANQFKIKDPDTDAYINSTGFGLYLDGGTAREVVTTISGLDHLEGETVTSLGDGVVETGHVVTSGSITLSRQASFVHVGIPYVSELETLDIEIIADTGSTQGRFKAMTSATIFFKDTREARVSTSGRPETIRDINFKDEADGEAPTPLFTGSKQDVAVSAYAVQERIKIEQVEPLPIHIKRIIPDVDYGG
jgi:hypothetical protein